MILIVILNIHSILFNYTFDLFYCALKKCIMYHNQINLTAKLEIVYRHKGLHKDVKNVQISLL